MPSASPATIGISCDKTMTPRLGLEMWDEPNRIPVGCAVVCSKKDQCLDSALPRWGQVPSTLILALVELLSCCRCLSLGGVCSSRLCADENSTARRLRDVEERVRNLSFQCC